MARIKYIILLTFVSILPFCTSLAQDYVMDLNKGSIEAQLNLIIEKSSTYQDFKVIKINWLSTLKSHLADSLNKFRNQVAVLKNKEAHHQSRIDSLKNLLQTKNDELTTISNTKDSIPFLFFDMGKDVYNKLVWSLIGVLAIALTIIILFYKRSKVVFNQAQTDLEEKKNELEAFRKRALERESQLSRSYLNELNKYKSNPSTKL